GGRAVGPLMQGPGVRAERKVDRDAAVAVLQRGDDVAPQVVVRERAGVEDDGRPRARRVPGEGTEPGFQLSGFHGYKTYPRYAKITTMGHAGVLLLAGIRGQSAEHRVNSAAEGCPGRFRVGRAG